eukprot:502217_1
MFHPPRRVFQKTTREEEQKSKKKSRGRHDEYFQKALELFQKTNHLPFKSVKPSDNQSNIEIIFVSGIKHIVKGLGILMQIQDFKQIQEQIRKRILERLLDIINYITHNKNHDCKYM